MRAREHFMHVAFTVEQVLHDLMQPDKINLASLGNKRRTCTGTSFNVSWMTRTLLIRYGRRASVLGMRTRWTWWR